MNNVIVTKKSTFKNLSFLIDFPAFCWRWLKTTLFLLGCVWSYQFYQVNFRGRGVSYNVSVLEAYAEQAVADALTMNVKSK